MTNIVKTVTLLHRYKGTPFLTLQRRNFCNSFNFSRRSVVQDAVDVDLWATLRGRAIRVSVALRTAKRLHGFVQNAAAVFATDDFSARFYTMRRLGGHFHVAAGTNFVFKCDNNRVAFAFEKTFEAAQ